MDKSIKQNVSPIKIVDVHKPKLVEKGYKDLNAWMNNPKHLYIGRRIIQNSQTFDSKYANPYDEKKLGTREALKRYYQRWEGCDLSELLQYDELGCWCCESNVIPNSIDECNCHGEVLLMLLFKHEKHLFESEGMPTELKKTGDKTKLEDKPKP